MLAKSSPAQSDWLNNRDLCYFCGINFKTGNHARKYHIDND